MVITIFINSIIIYYMLYICILKNICLIFSWKILGHLSSLSNLVWLPFSFFASANFYILVLLYTFCNSFFYLIIIKIYLS